MSDNISNISVDPNKMVNNEVDLSFDEMITSVIDSYYSKSKVKINNKCVLL